MVEREKDLENRVRKIEAYIGGCEKTKEQKWKDDLYQCLKEVKVNLKTMDDRQIRTRWQWPANLGLTAMIVGITWVIARTQVLPDLNLGLTVFFIGLAIGLGALFYPFHRR